MAGIGYWQSIVVRRATRRRALRSAGAVGLSAATLAVIGCGSDGNKNKNASRSDGQYKPVDTTSKATKGGVLARIGSERGYDITRAAAENANASPTYSRLVKYSVAKWPERPQPDVVSDAALSWEMAPDGLSATYKLRQGMKFDPRPPTNGKVMTSADVASTLLYFGMDVLATALYDGYSYTDQTISELSAIGAPTRSLWIPLAFVYSVLTIACGFGVWASAGQKRALRVVAGCVAGIGILGLVAWPFAPMHQREVLAAGGETLSDTMHLILGTVDTLLFVLSIAFGATAFGKRFRLYSIATILFVLASGALTGMDASKVAANEPTPWVGVTERIAVFGSMLWIAVLAIALLRVQASRPQATGGQ